ncbi:MAG: hypothetical protein GEU68_05930 [Actinobacteria bacterium]|nr:hypothetical protein [Actinomycetota bacterium]
MGRFLVIGAMVAAALQTFVPQSIIGGVANTPVISILAMMALAFLLSLCSESDAFVAASFVQFGVGGQLAFLVFGPMVDTKLGILYGATFRQGFFRTSWSSSRPAPSWAVCGSRFCSDESHRMSAVRTSEGLQPRERAAESTCSARVLDCPALGSWAGVFWWLLIADRTSLFLSTRTAWVVPAGAILLAVGLLGRLLSVRTEEPSPSRRARPGGSV